METPAQRALSIRRLGISKRWAIVAAILLVLLLGSITIRYFYWLMYPGLPIYP